MKKDILVDEILKVAGIKSNFTGAILGSGIGTIKANSDNEKNPNRSVESKATNLGIMATGGALAGGAIPSVGKGIANKAGKLMGMVKKSEIEVPENQENVERDENESAKDEVLNSPNKDEIRKINNSVSDRKSELKDQIEKAAELYMQETTCENCGFEGRMTSADGRCPECQSMGGVQLKEVPSGNRGADIESREQRRNRLYDEINNAKKDVMSYY